MSQLSFSDKARVARATVADARRRGVARLLGSPLMRWRYGAPVAEALTLVPQSLRLTDPSFALEIASGSFGLAGFEAQTGGFSPFDIAPPSPAWARALHGFSWLVNLEADGTPAAAEAAQRLVGGFIEREGKLPALAREPAVMGRRIISWLTCGELLLGGVDQACFDRTAQSLVRQLKTLSAVWSSAPGGYQRLEALLGVVYGNLCIAGHEAYLAQSEERLGAELDRQILPDGGHATRNAQVLVDLLLDLVPLRHCYLALQRPLPPAVGAAISRMMSMVKYLQLGDGSLARFNGVGAPPAAEISAVLAYGGAASMPAAAQHSRYARLEGGGMVAICDVGAPPALEMAATAHAGCLSFELSIGNMAVLVNGGRPLPAEHKLVAMGRSTAAHNTAVLGDRSSARLVRNAPLERLAGDMPLCLDGAVSSRLLTGEAGPVLEAQHEGYLVETGLVHMRRLEVHASGGCFEGRDRLCGPKGALRLPHDVPFASHFHIAPRVEAAIDGHGAVELKLPDGGCWSFAADGGHVSLEPSTHFADPAGAVRSRQIVLRGACFGETNVTWRLARVQR